MKHLLDLWSRKGRLDACYLKEAFRKMEEKEQMVLQEDEAAEAVAAAAGAAATARAAAAGGGGGSGGLAVISGPQRSMYLSRHRRQSSSGGGWRLVLPAPPRVITDEELLPEPPWAAAANAEAAAAVDDDDEEAAAAAAALAAAAEEEGVLDAAGGVKHEGKEKKPPQPQFVRYINLYGPEVLCGPPGEYQLGSFGDGRGPWQDLLLRGGGVSLAWREGPLDDGDHDWMWEGEALGEEASKRKARTWKQVSRRGVRGNKTFKNPKPQTLKHLNPNPNPKNPKSKTLNPRARAWKRVSRRGVIVVREGRGATYLREAGGGIGVGKAGFGYASACRRLQLRTVVLVECHSCPACAYLQILFHAVRHRVAEMQGLLWWVDKLFQG